MIVIAIDPGLSGAWAALDSISGLVEADDLPTAGEGSQRRIDGPTFGRIVRDFAPGAAIVEEVSALPRQGVSSMFRFGRAVGSIEAVLATNGVPIHRVTPGEWKRHFRLTGKVNGSGEPSRQRAIELFPTRSAALFARKKDHNRAEAALIGLWYLHKERGGA